MLAQPLLRRQRVLAQLLLCRQRVLAQPLLRRQQKPSSTMVIQARHRLGVGASLVERTLMVEILFTARIQEPPTLIPLQSMGATRFLCGGRLTVPGVTG